MSLVWYFAYGSNMQRATFAGRRGIQYERALGARVPGWRLVFDKPPLLPIGHSFANIIPDSAGEVLGVLYEISEEELAHIDFTEGVLIGNYTRVGVQATRLAAPNDEAVPAFTLTSSRRDPTLRPSLRYMNLLIEGAREHALPEAYIAYLRTIPAVEDSASAKLLRPLLDTAMRRWRPLP